jgi:phage baseplate assembly protein gpV
MRPTCRIAASLTVVGILLALVPVSDAQPRAIPGRPAIGVASALVVDVEDPEALGRIKVRFPWLRDGKEEAEAWARVSLPLGGNATGFWTLPGIDDEVLVAFEHGDLRRPVVLGSLWNGADAPPPGGGSGGTLTSPNGLFSISVTDAGITIRGPNAVVQLTTTQVLVDAEDTAIRSDGQTAIASGATTSINGTLIRLNGSNCPPLARVGDRVQFGEVSTIVTGSPTITGC